MLHVHADVYEPKIGLNFHADTLDRCASFIIRLVAVPAFASFRWPCYITSDLSINNEVAALQSDHYTFIVMSLSILSHVHV